MVTGGGVIIGTIAALLGAGGSVVTVPCYGDTGMQCRSALAHPTRFLCPWRYARAVTYAVIGWHSIPLSGFLGFISLKILGLLVLTGWAG